MNYVLAGKHETFSSFIRKNKLEDHSTTGYIYLNKTSIFNNIDGSDTIIFLPGWWARKFVEKNIKNILSIYPDINCIYLDGKFGEERRKNLKSDKIYNRFDLLDL